MKALSLVFISVLALTDCQTPPLEVRQASRSNNSGHRVIETHFDVNLTRTRENPLKGFYTDYDWHYQGRTNDFPSSLEFAYLPLSQLMAGPSTFTFQSGLEPRLVAAAARSHQLVVRVYLDYPGKPSGLPDFLKGRVHMNNYTKHGGGQSPDYSNSDLQKAIMSFIAQLGRQYDGDRRLGVVQAGLLGYWGEWHTHPHTEWFADKQFQIEVLKAYDSAFKTTLLQVRYPSKESLAVRFGYHDDSFAQDTVGTVGWFFQNRMVSVGGADKWKHVSIGGELRPELQKDIFEDGYTTGTYRQDFSRCVNQTHASMMLYGGAFSRNAFSNSPNERQNAELAVLPMGYAYHVPRVVLENTTLHVDIQNLGVAPFYPRLYLQVSDSAQVSSFVQVMLPRLTSDSVLTFDLDVISLSAPSKTSPWFISLESDYVLPQQDVLLATESGDDVIRIA